PLLSFFFFTSPPTTELYTLSLHDALPIWTRTIIGIVGDVRQQNLHDPPPPHIYESLGDSPADYLQVLVRTSGPPLELVGPLQGRDRKSTRLNSSHVAISYAVFCLKKKKKQ